MIKLSATLIISLFVFIVTSCSDEKRGDVDRYNIDRTRATASINDSNFRVKNPIHYAKSFLDSLKGSNYAKSYQISDDILILDGKDTMNIPVDLPIEKRLMFEGSQGGKHYLLMLTQMDYTTLSFGLACYENKEHVYTETGFADLPSLFFLGVEIDNDDKTETRYESIEYWGSNKSCKIALRIGTDDANEILVKVKRICTDSTRNINLENSPTFRKVKDAAKTI